MSLISMIDVRRFKPVPASGSIIYLKAGCYIQNDKLIVLKDQTIALIVDSTNVLCTLLSATDVIKTVLSGQGDMYDVIVNV